MPEHESRIYHGREITTDGQATTSAPIFATELEADFAKPGYVSIPEEVDAQDQMQAVFDKMVRTLTLQSTLTVRNSRLERQLAQAKRDAEAIREVAGLDMVETGDGNVHINGIVDGKLVDLTGTLGIPDSNLSTKNTPPQLLHSTGNIGGVDLEPGHARQVMGEYRYWIQHRQKEAAHAINHAAIIARRGQQRPR